MEKKKPRILKKNELASFHSLTVGELKKRLEMYPDDAPVLIERVHDVYYEKHGWGVYPAGSSEYHPAWSVTTIFAEPDILFIDLHY